MQQSGTMQSTPQSLPSANSTNYENTTQKNLCGIFSCLKNTNTPKMIPTGCLCHNMLGVDEHLGVELGCFHVCAGTGINTL